MNISNVTSNLKPTSKTASAVLLYVAGTAALVLPLIYPAIANRVLGPADAATVKALFFDTFRSAMPILLGGGGLGVVAASSSKTIGKVIAQLAPGMATAATPNGEGIGGVAAPSGDVLKDAGVQIPGNQIESATGVDLGQFMQRGIGSFNDDPGYDGEPSDPNAGLDFGVTEPFPRGVADTLDPSYFAEGDAP